MYYIGTDTDKKLNVPGFWPDPETLNKIPKEPYEIKAELARMKKERLEKRLRLEKKIAEEYGIDIEAEKAKIKEELGMNGSKQWRWTIFMRWEHCALTFKQIIGRANYSQST